MYAGRPPDESPNRQRPKFLFSHDRKPSGGFGGASSDSPGVLQVTQAVIGASLIPWSGRQAHIVPFGSTNPAVPSDGFFVDLEHQHVVSSRVRQQRAGLELLHFFQGHGLERTRLRLQTQRECATEHRKVAVNGLKQAYFPCPPRFEER